MSYNEFNIYIFVEFIMPKYIFYQREVSIFRPSGYEPDALPLRHPDMRSLATFLGQYMY